MSGPSDQRYNRAATYATECGLVLKQSLGFGKDGSVYYSANGHAIKAFDAEKKYIAEREVYQRLAECGVREILGFAVPRLIASSDALLVIEMTTVNPPYLLDFASAYVDYQPDFPPEVMEQWELDRIEEFGPRWPRVKLIIATMWDHYGVHLTDIHPRNIAFE